MCLCPSTEQDLGDGIAPGALLHAAGARLSVGSDQHVRTDLLAEARTVELHERLASEERGAFTPAQLLELLTSGGHASLGDPTGGRLAPGAPADLVAVRTDTPRTAGADPAQLVLVAGSADVDTVVVGGVVRSRAAGTCWATWRDAGVGDPRRVGGGPMTSHLVTGIGELVTHDPRFDGPLLDAALSRRTVSSSGSARRREQPAADTPHRPRRRRGGPRLRRLPHAPRLRGRPRGRVRGPHGGHAVHGRRHRDDGRGDAGGVRRRPAPTPRGPRGRGARPGHDDDRGQERVRPRRRRPRSACSAWPARSRRRPRSWARTSSRPASTAPTTSPW